MTADAYRQLGVLFDQLRELPNEDLAAALDAACGGDAGLRAELLCLIEADRAADQESFLGRRAIEDAARLITPEGSTAAPAEKTIDRYLLLEKIGEGGMGEVWLAEQRETVHRRVALKLVKAGMNTREVIARFESERQALALMDHPAIAKVFDAGSTPQGGPYFVMEYVAGVPITAYCDEHRLSTHARLELFVAVCEAVQHAHQKAIIHRDLKPSNIIVAEVDGRAAPKIIDFGVAKALTQKLSADTVFTHAGMIIGTLAYMSPEQANSAGEDIDTRSDVYSLGIILYELLAGVGPLDLEKITFDELLRRLREADPPTPSNRIRSQDPAASADVAHKRQTEPLALAKEMRGDLDWITLKALEKDRSRRYASASELAADIGRYLRNEPVLAAPPSALYRARKFSSRHRVPVATICACALALILAAVFSIRQRVRANEEAAVAQAVNDFLQNDLLAQASAAKQAGLGASPDPDLKVRTTLDRAAARITGRFDRQPEVEAAILTTIGQTYVDLGLYPEARKQLERALELYRRVRGRQNPKTLQSMRQLARVAFLEGKYPESEAQYKQALNLSRRALGAEDPGTLACMAGLALDYRAQGKFAPAEELQNQTLEIQRRVLGPEDPDTLVSMGNLAIIYQHQSKYAHAETLYNQTLEIQRRKLGPEHPDTLTYMNGLALTYYEDGKYEQAEALQSQTLAIEKRVLGPEHQATLKSMNNLAIDYYVRGKYADAETLYGQTLEIQRRVLGPEHPDTLTSMGNLAGAYFLLNKFAAADSLLAQALKVKRRVLGPNHPSTLYTLSYMAFACQRRGNFALAESYAAEALAGRRRTLGEDNRDTMASAADLALAYISEKRFAQGEPLAREAMEIDRKERPNDWQGFRAECILGASLAGQKKYSEAEPLLLDGYREMDARKSRIRMEDRYHLDVAREWLYLLYEVQGQLGRAAEWKKKGA
ncbi:MAG TPA: serine/threonine-protein kinase [Bryobacteraceae bacterium]|nr:serine/threonine-protein kinase [Bryobacteraceae bacterium]